MGHVNSNHRRYTIYDRAVSEISVKASAPSTQINGGRATSLPSLLGYSAQRLLSRRALQPSNWRHWMRRLAEEYRRIQHPSKNLSVRVGSIHPLYNTYIENNTIGPTVLDILSIAARRFVYRPKISIVMPVYNEELRWLKIAVDSVKCQIYPDWELCIADNAPTDRELLKYLRMLDEDRRVKVVFRPTNGHISVACNSAAKLATGDFVVFMDSSDVLAPNALFEITYFLQAHRDADLIYTDEDKIDRRGRRYDPHFKPDWSPELLLAYNYISRLTCMRRKLFERLGRFRKGYEGSQHYDLLLRTVAESGHIHHIPKVLYHSRALKPSAAASASVKPIVHTSGDRALEDHLRRVEISGTPYHPDFAQHLHPPINMLDWPDDGPSVAIVIPTYNQKGLLKKCVDSLLEKTTYRNYRIVVVDNDSDDQASIEYIAHLPETGVFVERISNEGRPFSFSRVNNLAVERVNEDLVLFLNNDTEVIEPRWLSRMVGYLGLPGVGATGARLLFEDGTIQHAGVILGLGNGIAPGHAFFGQRAKEVSYLFQAEVSRPCAALTAACLLTRRDLFREMGGFNREHYAVSLNDVDFCMRLAERGLRSVFVGSAELLHHETQTRGRIDDPAELAHFRRTYGDTRDPYYNPNLSRVQTFQIDTGCHLDYQPFLGRPIKALLVTHNLHPEGATKSLYELAVGLQHGGRVHPTVFSPVSGIGESWYREAGIDIYVESLPNYLDEPQGWRSSAAYEATIALIRAILEKKRPDIVIANTLNSFYAIDAATRADIPSVWIIQESYSRKQMRQAIQQFSLPHCEKAFCEAYRVVFVSNNTMQLYWRYNSRHNFVVVHNGLDACDIDRYITRVSNDKAAHIVQAPTGKKILTTVGAICDRKDQLTLAKAVKVLRRKRNDFCCYMVGLRQGYEYFNGVKRFIEENELEKVVKLISETKDVYPYYRASDIFILTSHFEASNRAILEAEAFGLPIITTRCSGIFEQVRGDNALFFNASNSGELARHIARLLDDDEDRLRMGRNSRSIFEFLLNYGEMIERYEQLAIGGWMWGHLSK